jgi:hypothetical protein
MTQVTPPNKRTTLGDMVLDKMQPLTVTYLQSIHRVLQAHGVQLT